ncbi:MAG: hypothetical protein H6Q99_1325 [Proteobacteria bacterium]|nr:hypothetical protein [Pseudomonadota bacterium]
MNRSFYIDLANHGLKMPMGTDIVLNEHSDPEAIRIDGQRLGEVMIEAARRYRTPLALPQMNLALEKEALLVLMGLDGGSGEFHFSTPPTNDQLARFEAGLKGRLTPGCEANIEAIAHVAQTTDLVPLGMCIGPFSLMTKLLADPIMPVTLAGMGNSAADNAEVALMEAALELSTRLVLEIIGRQIKAGAKMIVIAEPAANKVFFSPKLIRRGSDIFERFAMAPNRKIVELLRENGVELFFHCCGELIDEMVVAFASLDPAVLSLGSSRILWQDAALVPRTTVLYGNLPSKKFYSPTLFTCSQVSDTSRELITRMREIGHPFILGTECDVLHVPGCECTIKTKLEAIMEAVAV